MNAFDLEPHDYANIFPMPPTEGDEWENFKASISGDRQREPIMRFEGKLLDGRGRYEACRQLDQRPYIADFPGTKRAALEYVKERNYNRRHMTPTQRLTSLTNYHAELEKLSAEAMKAAGARGVEGGRGRKKKTPETFPSQGFSWAGTLRPHSQLAAAIRRARFHIGAGPVFVCAA